MQLICAAFEKEAELHQGVDSLKEEGLVLSAEQRLVALQAESKNTKEQLHKRDKNKV